MSDSHALHARVMSVFAKSDAPSPRATFGALHRLEVSEQDGLVTLLLQSKALPNWERLPAGFLDPRIPNAAASTSMDTLLQELRRGDVFHFKLRANPTRKIDTKSSPEGARRNGKRVPIHGDLARAEWLARKLSEKGMVLQPGLIQRAEGRTVANGFVTKKTHEAHVFAGLLQIENRELAIGGIVEGIGPAKAYGFGLLSLAPASPRAEWG